MEEHGGRPLQVSSRPRPCPPPHYLVFPGRRPYQIVGPWTSATAPSAPATTATAPTTSTTTSTSNRTSQPEETAPSPQTGGCGVLHIRVLKCGKTRVEVPVSAIAVQSGLQAPPPSPPKRTHPQTSTSVLVRQAPVLPLQGGAGKGVQRKPVSMSALPVPLHRLPG